MGDPKHFLLQGNPLSDQIESQSDGDQIGENRAIRSEAKSDTDRSLSQKIRLSRRSDAAGARRLAGPVEIKIRSERSDRRPPPRRRARSAPSDPAFQIRSDRGVSDQTRGLGLTKVVRRHAPRRREAPRPVSQVSDSVGSVAKPFRRQAGAGGSFDFHGNLAGAAGYAA